MRGTSVWLFLLLLVHEHTERRARWCWQGKVLDCSLSSAVSYQKRTGSIIIDMNATLMGDVTLRTRHIISCHVLPPNVWLADAFAQR